MDTNLLGGLFGQLVQADQTIKATRLSLQCALGDALDLDLSLIRWVLAPAADAALVNTQSLRGCGLGVVEGGHIGCFHAAIMGLPICDSPLIISITGLP